MVELGLNIILIGAYHSLNTLFDFMAHKSWKKLVTNMLILVIQWFLSTTIVCSTILSLQSTHLFTFCINVTMNSRECVLSKFDFSWYKNYLKTQKTGNKNIVNVLSFTKSVCSIVCRIRVDFPNTGIFPVLCHFKEIFCDLLLSNLQVW